MQYSYIAFIPLAIAALATAVPVGSDDKRGTNQERVG